jgi:hypothetical protein
MDVFSGVFEFMVGTPAMVGLILTAAIIFLTSDWRLSLAALLIQYVLLGLTLTRLVPVEVAVVQVLIGVLILPMLYLSARNIQKEPASQQASGLHFLGLSVGWGAGPLGLPLRLLTVLLAALVFVRFFPAYQTALLPFSGEGIPSDIVLIAFWLLIMGIAGIVVSGDALRSAPAVLTILAGFGLIYASLEPNLAIAGFLGALTLLAALAFSYLIAVQALGQGTEPAGEEESAP